MRAESGNSRYLALSRCSWECSWLVKGKNLILRGLQEVPGLPDEITPDTSVPDASSTPKKRSIGLYVLLSLGSLLLIAWVGLLVFDASDQSILPVIRESQSQTVPTANFAQGWFTMLLAWWPYACWKRILEREGNTTFKSVFRHRRITAARWHCVHSHHIQRCGFWGSTWK